VTSAQANATLAGVLAGFMLNGIIVLLSRNLETFRQVRALGLLFAAFVALGLDSYLFGLVTGDSVCGRAWTEAMLAAGLLGMGAVAIIAGFGLLVAEYVPRGEERAESVKMLQVLFNVLRAGVAAVVLALLFMTSWNYLYAVRGNSVPTWAKLCLAAYVAVGFLAVGFVCAAAFHPEQPSNALTRTWQAVARREWQKISAKLTGADHAAPQVSRAIYFSFGYSILSVIAASFFARTSPRPWDQAHPWVIAVYIATPVWVLVASLVPLFLLLVRCAPPFSYAAAGSHASRSDGHSAPSGYSRPVPELQRLRADHAPAVLAFELANRDYFAASISDRGDEFFDQFAERHSAMLAEQEAGLGAYYVLVAEDGSILGRFNLYRFQDGTAELGYRVAQHVAGRGVATANVRELCWLAAERHGLRTLRAATARENVASGQVLAKAGFVPVGPADPADLGGKPGTWYQRDLAAG